MRQQNGSRLSTERRRYKINSIIGNNFTNSKFTRSLSNTFQHTLPSRQIQQLCRSFKSPSPTPGVAFITCMCGSNLCKVGQPNDRSFCIKNGTCNKQLCVSRFNRSSSLISRCIQRPMELSNSMGISTPIFGSQSINSLKSVDGDIFVSSSSVGKSILASGSENPRAISTVYSEEPQPTSSRYVDRPPTSESRRDCTGGVEMWGWSSAIESWNSEQRSLLKNSWRKSTLKTYQTAWARWISWCRNKSINPTNPTGSQLAQFLCDLYLVDKLSYNTILLHKSVVATLCNTDMFCQLSSHVLVKHILKAISLKNPKTCKPPIWNVSKLCQFLNNCIIDMNNIFQVSRHTAILLLLCSGRRIHDLTLLRIDPPYCVKSDDNIIFWPQFGSKTDSSTYRQSGWKLLLNPDNRNLNPLFWIERTISLLKERRDATKSFNLFITIRGVAKPASRTVIAGWIRTLLKEADIAATPGSVRSAVASKSWLENHSVEDILARGNWQSVNTFQQFYRREVIRSDNSDTITRLFNPIT
ncbi:uncharacterized protein LOC128202292 [Galleria mellonella]|uniref:Uncharacterized protein LOC128202292 n=1 Tax=Galleria mellonella TaxID=7137 RepID=A0ABM3N366_GALME|nr:uncharacterized protein LOC128202292 [Galleria mellonella]